MDRLSPQTLPVRAGPLAPVLLACACATALLAGGVSQAPAQRIPRPNIVVIQVDDMPANQLTSTFVDSSGSRTPTMPNTQALIGDAGVRFSRYYTTYPLCCPSRASLLTGLYPHSHGVLGNVPPRGGYTRFPKLHNLAVWLQRANYRTIHIGKFLNGYGDPGQGAENEIPPGWSDWQTLPGLEDTLRYYGYRLNHNGNVEGPFGDPGYGPDSGKDFPGCPDQPPLLGTCNYQTDVLTARAVQQIEASAGGGAFFLSLDYVAPHGDRHPPIGPEPAARHYNSAVNTPLPRRPGFNEADISDKPGFLRRDAEPLDAVAVARMRREYQKSLEAMRSVDEGVSQVIAALARTTELDNTYVFFLSDNGFFQGEHRLERSKFLPYEPATHLPLLIRGPGITPGSSSGELVANIDIAPTILLLARAQATRRLEGRSLIRFWQDTSKRTLRPLLIESFARASDIEGGGTLPGAKRKPGATASLLAPIEDYLAVRLGPYKYVEWRSGDRELYDLSTDPHEQNSRHRDPRLLRVRTALRELLLQLENCGGPECKRLAEPLPAPGFGRRGSQRAR